MRILLSVFVLAILLSLYTGFIKISFNKSVLREKIDGCLYFIYSKGAQKAAASAENTLAGTVKAAKESYRALRGSLREARRMLHDLKTMFIPPSSHGNHFFIPPVMNAEERKQFDDAFRIFYCGDLILLEDQVKRAKAGDKYEFDSMFEYTRKYIQAADLSIGVFEGPTPGEEAGYSRSNCDDLKEVRLSFPDSFAEAVKRAGFGLVTLSNNHLLDKGKQGALRTIELLKSIGLEYTGSYTSPEEKEKERVKLIEKDGLKFAFLSYTYGCNFYEEDEMLFSDDVNYTTSILVSWSSKNFDAVKESVKKDFELAKSMKPDFIVVMPHIGGALRTKPDNTQKIWANVFAELGADMILMDHTHSVEPAEIRTVNGRKVFIAYCPGNYTNIYRYYNGDAGILAEIYIDRNKKEIIGGSIIPMWTCANMNGNYRPLSMNAIADGEISSQLTTYDFERAEEVNRVITSTVFGHAFNFDMVREKYYFDERGYIREKVLPLQSDVSDSRFMRLINSHESVCFVGDSLTQGSLNGGYPYYEPLESQIKAEIHNVSYGGATVQTLIENADEITATNSGLYVIAIGTNDVRYRDAKICAMTPEEYISRIQSLEKIIRQKRKDAKFLYIAPWWSDDGDSGTQLKYDEKFLMNEEYSEALKNHCKREGHEYFDVNGYISTKVLASTARYYLNDHIHPNSRRGIYLLCEALTLCE